ncbi:MAG: sodium/glutamate symporter [Pseudomonadota bacterium]
MTEDFLVNDFLAVTMGLIVFFLGRWLNDVFHILEKLNIPDAVSGGVTASLFTLGIFLVSGLEITYELATRDQMLVYFFTTIGLNARFEDLARGGRPLGLLLVLTLGYIVIQDVVGLAGARLLGLPDAIGILAGSASLIGGHGTAIAWAPEIASSYGVENALEVGVAAATLGLVMASFLGGPIAYLLLERKDLSTDDPGVQLIVGVEEDDEARTSMTLEGFFRALLVIHLCILIGYFLNIAVNSVGINLPLFVSCLVVGIFSSNIFPRIFKDMRWPARTKSLAFIAELSLALFISMSLMSMKLWSIADLALPLLSLLAAQAIAAVLFIIFVLFPTMGRNYSAAVLSSGFAGFSLGSTPTAIANMTAVTKSHGPAPMAFLILPLVGAFFVDITNAFVIQFFLNL